jgi:2',3'-cyclic-nucleotide 2'-phosphodiesterase
MPEYPPRIPNTLRILLIGDIVGKPGLSIVCQSIATLRSRLRVDVIIANAENAADGAGLTISQYQKLMAAGVDAITLGDHIYKKKEIIAILQSERNIVKPANFPSTAPGHDHSII